jgi:hypothetical protein
VAPARGWPSEPPAAPFARYFPSLAAWAASVACGCETRLSYAEVDYGHFQEMIKYWGLGISLVLLGWKLLPAVSKQKTGNESRGSQSADCVMNCQEAGSDTGSTGLRR